MSDSMNVLPVRSTPGPGRHRTSTLVVAGAAALVGGVVLGAGTGAAVAVAGDDQPAPAPAVTVTAAPVAVVPQQCLAALDDADEVAGMASRFARVFSDHMAEDSQLFLALSSGTAGPGVLAGYQAHVDEVTGEVASLTLEVDANQFAVHRDECRALAG